MRSIKYKRYLQFMTGCVSWLQLHDIDQIQTATVKTMAPGGHTGKFSLSEHTIFYERNRALIKRCFIGTGHRLNSQHLHVAHKYIKLQSQGTWCCRLACKGTRPICGTQTNKQTKYSHIYKEKEKKKIEQTNVKEKGSIINVKNFKDQQKIWWSIFSEPYLKANEVSFTLLVKQTFDASLRAWRNHS